MLEQVPSPYLFPGAGSRHKMGALLSKQVADLVEAEVGVRLTAHQFRHLAGFLYLKAHPGGHEVVRSLLGHKSIETTILSTRAWKQPPRSGTTTVIASAAPRWFGGQPREDRGRAPWLTPRLRASRRVAGA